MARARRSLVYVLAIGLCAALVLLLRLWLGGEGTPRSDDKGQDSRRSSESSGSVLTKREQQRAIVEECLRKAKALPDEEKARVVWRMWVRIREENWSWEWDYQDELLTALRDTGDEGMKVLLEDIRQPGTLGASEAIPLLRCFRPKAMHELINLLGSGPDNVKLAALRALWHFSPSQMSREDHNALRVAVTPFLDHPSADIRKRARWIIEDLDYYPPAEAAEDHSGTRRPMRRRGGQ
jgi:hypothetical protein